MQKVVLITALDKNDPYHTFGVNLGPLALEAYISEHSDIEAYVVEDLHDIKTIKPDLVGISSVTENYPRAIALAKQIKKELSVPIILGGVHISTLPQSLDPVFTAAVIGEGEETFLELLKNFPKLDKVAGVALWKNKKVQINSPRKPISNLDSLPIPNRAKWVEKLGAPFLMTTRGCPYHCSFCASPVHWNGCRKFSPEHVAKEIKDIVDNFPIKNIRFFDDVLTMDKKRLEAIVDLIVGERLHEKIAFWCFARVGMVDEKLVEILAKGNVKFVDLGVESVSDAILKRIKDKTHKHAQSQKAIDCLHNAGRHIGVSFLVGVPGETEKDLCAMGDFIEKNESKLFSIEINPLIPYPGTEIWFDAKKRGLVSDDMDFTRLKDYSILTLFNPDKYIYLNDKIPYKVFLKYMEKFVEMFKRISFGPEKIKIMQEYFKLGDLPAKLKGASPVS